MKWEVDRMGPTKCVKVTFRAMIPVDRYEETLAELLSEVEEGIQSTRLDYERPEVQEDDGRA
jgi:hypothetical protein